MTDDTPINPTDKEIRQREEEADTCPECGELEWDCKCDADEWEDYWDE